jgi:hypothetical protein
LENIVGSWADLLDAVEASGPAAVEFPLGRGEPCVLVHGFLSAHECDALIQAAEQRGFAGAGPDYPPSYRDNDRLVADDPNLAGQLFERLAGCATRSAEVAGVMRETDWSLVGVNERLRFCRYLPGTQFRAHQDGVHHRPCSQSRLTFMVYLNDNAFTGGDTVFFEGRSSAMAGHNPAALRPRKGSLILFSHALWHAGARVHTGVKYVMRSELMYQPEHPEKAGGTFRPGHRGYVWALAALHGVGMASGGRDATIRLWSDTGAPLGTLDGHTQSVLGLVEMEPGVLISHSRDRTIRRWTVAGGASRIVGTSDAAVLSAARLDRERLVTGDASGKLAVWNLTTGTTETWSAHGSWIWAIAPLREAGFATASEDGSIRLWRSADNGATVTANLGHPLRTLASRAMRDGVMLAAGDVEGVVHLLVAGQELERLGIIAAHDGPVRRVRFESEHILLTCGEDGLVRRWDLRSRQGTVIAAHRNFATDVLCVGPGRWISCGYDGRIGMHSSPEGQAPERR